MQMNDNLFFSQFVKKNEQQIKTTLEDMTKHGWFYRSMRSLLTVLQIIPPINFMSASDDIEFSDILNAKLYGTTASVFTIKTHRWDAIWSAPVGAPIHSRPIFQSIPFYNLFHWFSIHSEQQTTIANAQHSVSLTNDNRIKIVGLPNVTIYRSERMSEILNIDEQIAVSIFEIAKNCLLFETCINKTITKICLIIMVIFGGAAAGDAYGTVKLNQFDTAVSREFKVQPTDMSSFNHGAAWAFIVMAIIILGAATFLLYHNRKHVWNLDHVVEQAGYRMAMASALKKLDMYHSGGSFNLSGAIIPEQVINVIDTIIYQIQKVLSLLKLNFTPYINDRINHLSRDRKIDEIQLNNDNSLNSNFIFNNNINLIESVIDKTDIAFNKIVNDYLIPLL